jgi:hypothetical protein
MGCVTAPPGAPYAPSDNNAPATEESGTTAFGLLSRAQAIADVLRTEVEAEVAAMRHEAGAAQEEARRLLADATAVHDEAAVTQRSAQRRLREAQEEAAQLVADAADQATLVAAAANLTTETLLADTQAEADQIRSAAKAQDVRLRHLATTELENVREKNTVLLSEAAAQIQEQQLQVTAELQKLGREATQHATSVRTAAQDSSNEAVSRANTEAGLSHAMSMQELAQARAEIVRLRSSAAAEIASTRDAATAEADRVLGDAADQLHWTQDTIAALLLTAEVEADRMRQAERESNSVHLSATRRQLQDVIARVALRLRTDVVEAAAEAKRLRAQASAILVAADKDTTATRQRAMLHAERVVNEAELTAQAALQRGQRRLDEAESGARVLRERAAQTVSALQTEAHEHRRAVRDEATNTLAAARADADTSRAEARELLTQARAEVKVLADRRDDITAQLGNLQGVIEALTVPERVEKVSEHYEPAAGTDAPIPENAETTSEDAKDNLSLTTNATTGTR